MSVSSNSIKSSGVRPASCRPTRVFKGHTKRVGSVAYFPDGRHIASASDDKTIIVWDVESGRQDGQPLQHGFSVTWIAISPDGRKIASGMEKGGLLIWDVLTREVVHGFNESGVDRLAYSLDGRWIAAAPMANAREIWLWDADTGRPGGEPLECDGNVYCVAFSPDGSRIAAGLKDGSFQVLDIVSGESVVGPVKGHMNWLSSVVYSPDGRLLVTASWNRSIRVWDSKTGVQVGKSMKGAISCISIADNGRRIASGGLDGTVRVWDLETRLQLGDSVDVRGRVASVAFSPNGRYVSSDGTHGAVCLWDTEIFAIQGSSFWPVDFVSMYAYIMRILCPDNTRKSFRPTTDARNAPKARDHTRSVTSSSLDLLAVQRGFRQGISRFCNTLSKPQISISLVEAPNDWLRANSSQILQVPSIYGKERVEVDLIYPRFFVYTLELLECYVPSEVEGLKAKYIEWTNNVDEITQLINHESIMDTLNCYLTRHETVG
ncbi:WD40 repeat-like protein [Leucogyrophana mollusca]|uniref:WD40 repeat-like protein n=1 Tax=Leucogyrophana mollusca TaxID=85980 RepID=A0ACB8BGD8_9AGAM|nr:WD40 repeat-like protein [Leucogyrophana mollusca]